MSPAPRGDTIGVSSTSPSPSTGATKACTLCVVRPHVVRDGGLGAVLSFVAKRGFQVSEIMRRLRDGDM